MQSWRRPTAERLQRLRPIRQPDEPIARACRHGWERLAHWWNHGPMTTPLKIGLLVVLAIVAIFNGPWLMAGAVVLGSIYLVYLGIRLLTQALRAPAAPTAIAALDAPQHRLASASLGGARPRRFWG